MKATFPLWSTGPRMDQFRCLLGLATLVLAPQVHAINDIPEGELLWLQGFDLNPLTPGFRVDGTLLLRSVDDIAHIGVNLSSGAITNSPTGAIRVEVGVTGARFINGSVLNQGEFKVDSGMSFNAANTYFHNTGSFTVGPSFVARFLGKGTQFTQEDGSLAVGERGFELHDGTFAFTGGEISGQPIFFRTQVTYATANGLPFEPRLIGPGGSFRGPLGPDLYLRILGASGQGGDTAVTLADTGELRGRLEVGQYSGGSNVRIVAANGSLNLAPTGSFTVKPTGGTGAMLDGNLANDGLVSVATALTVANASATATNRATLSLQSGGSVQFAGGFRHEAGELNLNGTTLGAAKGFTIAGPGARLNGRILAAVTNDTTLNLSQNDGELRVTGSFANRSAAALSLELSEGGLPTPLLSTTGALIADGRLTVTLIDGFEPQLGDSFPLFKMQSLSGRFRPLRLPYLPEGRYWHLLKTPTQWTLVVQDEAPLAELTTVVREGLPAIQLAGTPSRSATLYSSTDLKTWETLQTEEPFSGELTVSIPATANGTPLFFRGEVEP